MAGGGGRRPTLGWAERDGRRQGLGPRRLGDRRDREPVGLDGGDDGVGGRRQGLECPTARAAGRCFEAGFRNPVAGDGGFACRRLVGEQRDQVLAQVLAGALLDEDIDQGRDGADGAAEQGAAEDSGAASMVSPVRWR